MKSKIENHLLKNIFKNIKDNDITPETEMLISTNNTHDIEFISANVNLDITLRSIRKSKTESYAVNLKEFKKVIMELKSEYIEIFYINGKLYIPPCHEFTVRKLL